MNNWFRRKVVAWLSPEIERNVERPITAAPIDTRRMGELSGRLSRLESLISVDQPRPYGRRTPREP